MPRRPISPAGGRRPAATSMSKQSELPLPPSDIRRIGFAVDVARTPLPQTLTSHTLACSPSSSRRADYRTQTGSLPMHAIRRGIMWSRGTRLPADEVHRTAIADGCGGKPSTDCTACTLTSPAIGVGGFRLHAVAAVAMVILDGSGGPPSDATATSTRTPSIELSSRRNSGYTGPAVSDVRVISVSPS